MRRASSLETTFALCWKAVEGPELVREHRFAPPRLWRFDYAHLSSWTAIELEGGIWRAGRHSRGQGMVNDAEKYNAATFAGWAIIRLATGMVGVAWAEKIKEFVESRERFFVGLKASDDGMC